MPRTETGFGSSLNRGSEWLVAVMEANTAEERLRRLRQLGEKSGRPSRAEMAEIVTLMCKLKWEDKLTDRDISEGSGRRWAESTIRQLTNRKNQVELVSQSNGGRQKEISRDEEEQQRTGAVEGIGSFMRWMDDAGISRDQLLKMKRVHEVCVESGVEADELAHVISSCKKQGVSTDTMVNDYLWLESEEGIQLVDLSFYKLQKQRMDERGLTFDDIDKVLEAAKAAAGSSRLKKDELLDRVRKQGTLMSVEEEARKASEIKATAERDYKKIQEKLEKARPLLKTYDNLLTQGHTLGGLKDIADRTERAGGREKFMTKFAAVQKVGELEQKERELKISCQKSESRNIALNTTYASRMEAITMDEELISSGYSTETVKRIVKAARKLGNPANVFATLDELGNYMNIKQLNVQEEAKLKNTRKEITELESQLEAKHRIMMDTINDTISGFTNTLEQTASSAISRVEKNADDKLKHAQEFYTLRGQIEAEKELLALSSNLVRALNPPIEKAEPQDQSCIFQWLMAVNNLYSRNNFSYTVSGSYLTKKYGACLNNIEFKVVDLLRVASMAFFGACFAEVSHEQSEDNINQRNQVPSGW
jgi:hypothetical protein